VYGTALSFPRAGKGIATLMTQATRYSVVLFAVNAGVWLAIPVIFFTLGKAP
jgi:hypothetical protein